MKTISFKYRPIKFLNFYLAQSRQFPESWAEVSEAQFKAFEQLHFGQIDDVQFISIVFDLPKRIVNKCTDFLKYSMLECFEFMKDQLPLNDYLSAMQIKSKLENIQIKSPLDIMIEYELSQAEIMKSFKQFKTTER